MSASTLARARAIAESTTATMPMGQPWTGGTPSRVWYVSYGSNMWRHRLMRYIVGGSVRGSQLSTPGATDKSPPTAECGVRVPYDIYFGAGNKDVWGGGGWAFLSNATGACLGRAYLLSLEQFLEVVVQENDGECTVGSVRVGVEAALRHGDSVCLPNAWYGRVLYLGSDGTFPFMSFTGA